MDWKPLVEALIKGAPWAVFIAAIRTIWQLLYAHSRDKAKDKEDQAKQALETAKFENQKFIESKKFEYQKALETLRFEYEQRKWREQLAIQLALKHVDLRLREYPLIWSQVKVAARHMQANSLTPELARSTASAVESWRYSSGGLLAEETTRDAALAFQTALWDYNGSTESFDRIRQARRLLRAALRADMGLGEDILGESIFDATAKRHKIKEELANLQHKLGIQSDGNVGPML
jgi:hypothetical protein